MKILSTGVALTSVAVGYSMTNHQQSTRVGWMEVAAKYVMNALGWWYPTELDGKNPECDDLYLPYKITKPKTTEDVILAVQEANQKGLPICVKSGGHSYTCNHIQPDCLQIDLRDMDSVALTMSQDIDDPKGSDRGKYYLSFGTGARVMDLLAAAPESDWTFVHGECLSVGVGGYYLHGGVHLGWGTKLYGMGGQNVREMEVVLSNATSITVTDPSAIEHWTRAGSSFGLVTKIKLEIYKRPAPKSYIVPILSLSWTVEEIEEIYRKIWMLARTENDFQINLWLHTNSILPPSLQIAYLGTDYGTDSFERCIGFIEQNIGINPTLVSKVVSKLLRLTLPDYGTGYHAIANFRSFTNMVPSWKSEPYVTSNFIVDEEASYDMIKPYLNQIWSDKNARCLLLLNIVPQDVYPGDKFKAALDYTCFGEYRQLATDMTATLMNNYPDEGDYWKYYNIPTREENKCRYWPDYATLMNTKMQLDPDNRFDVFQGIHSSDTSAHDDGDCPADH